MEQILKTKKALIVDANPTVHAMLTSIFVKFGCEVKNVLSFAKMIEKLSSYNPDIIIISKEEATGHESEFFKALPNKKAFRLVIVNSDETAIGKSLIEKGYFHRMIVKPFQIEQVSFILKRLFKEEISENVKQIVALIGNKDTPEYQVSKKYFEESQCEVREFESAELYNFSYSQQKEDFIVYQWDESDSLLWYNPAFHKPIFLLADHTKVDSDIKQFAKIVALPLTELGLFHVFKEVIIHCKIPPRNTPGNTWLYEKSDSPDAENNGERGERKTGEIGGLAEGDEDLPSRKRSKTVVMSLKEVDSNEMKSVDDLLSQLSSSELDINQDNENTDSIFKRSISSKSNSRIVAPIATSAENNIKLTQEQLTRLVGDLSAVLVRSLMLSENLRNQNWDKFYEELIETVRNEIKRSSS